MAKIKLILCDDEGKPVTEVKAKDYALEVGNQTLDEIEAAVEEFKLKALPELESDLLKVAQAQLTEQVKKTDLGSRTAKL